MIHGHNGHRYLPGSAASVFNGVALCIGAVVALSIGFSSHRGGTFSLVALIVAVFMVYAAFSGFTKASAYRGAAIRYERERRNLSRRIHEARSGPGRQSSVSRSIVARPFPERKDGG